MRKFEIINAYKDKLDEAEFIPQRETKYSAGYDLKVAEDTVIPSYISKLGILEPVKGKLFTLKEAERLTGKELYNIRPTLVPTGLKVQCNNNEWVKIVPRSSTPLKYLLIMPNSEGVIDKDYYNNPKNEGHMYIQLLNLAPFDIVLKKGDRVAQAIFMPYLITNTDKASGVREGGVGSTSK